MFDKAKYWKRRADGERGQDKVAETFIPKGSNVEYATREGEKRLYPNDEGSYMRRIKGRGIVMFNRKDARRRIFDRHFTKHGFKGHAVNDPKQSDWRRDGLTNHERMLQRKATAVN